MQYNALMMIRHFTLFIFFSLFFSSLAVANTNIAIQHHEVKAIKGDGVISLLRRYKLNHYQDNVRKFYELNKLSDAAILHVGRSYKLPVTIYNYDGKSIRSTIGIDDWDKAVRIQKYNEYLLERGLRSTHYTTSKLLWVPAHELKANLQEDEITAPIAKQEIKKASSKVEQLFGSKYSRFELIDESLKNRVYYIISGHGGPDPGAMCTDCSSRLCEDEYAYDVGLRLARSLMQHGATVEMIITDDNDGIRDDRYLSCDQDEKLNNGRKIPLNQISRLNQRAFRVNDLYKKYQKQGVIEQSMVVIHVDSRTKSQRQDVFFYHYPKSNSSKQLAYDVMKTFEEKYAYHQKGRDYHGYVDQRNLHVLRVTQPKGVFIELANIRNKHDHKRILLHENRQALANWIMEGITRRVKKKSDEVIASS